MPIFSFHGTEFQNIRYHCEILHSVSKGIFFDRSGSSIEVLYPFGAQARSGGRKLLWVIAKGNFLVLGDE